jgi:hypothetical protein
MFSDDFIALKKKLNCLDGGQIAELIDHLETMQYERRHIYKRSDTYQNYEDYI